MSLTVVDRLYDEFEALKRHLDEAGEVSLRSTADENFRKSLLLAAASYFERRISDLVVEFAKESFQIDHPIIEFLKNKAISRQYHTYFKWDSSNANQFFGLFGETFRIFMVKEIKSDFELETSIKAFLELGNDRNRLVHQDFGTFPLEKTSDEIYQLYKSALRFVDSLPLKLRACTSNQQNQIQQ